MVKKKSSKELGRCNPNIIFMGVNFTPGKTYMASWFYGGGFVMNELVQIPENETNIEKFIREWVRELSQYLSLPTVDIHFKEFG